MNQQPNPTTYGRESQIRRESIPGLPELNLAVGNYRNYLNRLLSRLKDPKKVVIDQKVITKMVQETTRHLGAVLSISRANLKDISLAQYLEIVKAYLVIQQCFLGKTVDTSSFMTDSNETDEFLGFLKNFRLSDEQRNSLGTFLENLEAQKKSLEGLFIPLLPKFQQMIAASRQEITDIIQPEKKSSSEDSEMYEATTDRIHASTVLSKKKSGRTVEVGTRQFTELNAPGIKDDEKVSELQIEFLPESGKVGLPLQAKATSSVDQKIVKLLDKEGFEVVRKLGEGGMGVVYLAKDKNLGGALVAIKRILRQPGSDQEEWDDLTGRFKREGVAMAELTRQYPKGFTPIYGSFEIDGDPCIVMKCEQGPSDGVSDEAISKAITNGRRVFEFSRAKEWYLELEGFVAGHAFSISVDSVLHLADLALQSKIVKKGTKEFEILTHIKRKQYPGNEVTKDQLPTEALESAIRLKEVIEKHFFPVPVDEVMHYVKISKLHEGVTDGDKTMKLVRHLREYCGDNFPQDVYVKIWMLLSKDFLGTIRFMHEQGYINRDIKPSNLILTSEAAGILFQLLDEIMLLSPADKEVKQEKVRAAFERALQKMKDLDQAEEGTGLVKLIDLGLAKKIEKGKKASINPKKNVKNEAPLDPYLTQAGTVMGTPAFMTRAALMNSENHSVDGDFHAAALTILALLKGDEVVNLGKNHIGIGINLDTWSEEADKARIAGAKQVDAASSFIKDISKAISKYVPKKEEIKTPVSLSVAEKDPVLFAYLEEHHPPLAAWVQSATWLTKFKHRHEINWKDACDYMNGKLYPVDDSKRKVGLGVAVTLAVATVLGGVGYKVQSDRNAIAVQQKALEEKMNAIRLRVAQAQEMPEGTVEEMEAKVTTIHQILLSVETQKSDLNADTTEITDALNSAVVVLRAKVVNSLSRTIENGLRNLSILDPNSDILAVDQLIGFVDKLKSMSSNVDQIELDEIKESLNHFRLGLVFIRQFKEAMKIDESLLDQNPEYQNIVNSAIQSARSYIGEYNRSPMTSDWNPVDMKIPEQFIVPATSDVGIMNYARTITTREFPENLEYGIEFFQRTREKSLGMPYSNQRFLGLRDETEYKFARWLSLKIADTIYKNPTTVLNNPELSGMCRNAVVKLIEYYSDLSQKFELSNLDFKLLKKEIDYTHMHLAYSLLQLNPEVR